MSEGDVQPPKMVVAEAHNIGMSRANDKVLQLNQMS